MAKKKDEGGESTVAEQLLEAFDSFKTDYPKHVEKMEEVVKAVAPFKDLDIKKTMDEVEKLRAKQDDIIRAIRMNRSGPYVPGLEDEKEAKKFSMARAGWAIKTQSWEGAGYEEEVFKEARKLVKHVIGVDSEGGFFVPDQIIADVIGMIYARSVLIALNGEGTTRISILDGLTGGQVKIPKFKGGMIAFWIGELDEYVESATKLGDVTLTPKKLTLLTRISEEMRRWGGYGFENLLRQDMARAAAQKLDWSAIYAPGNENMPRGVVRQQGVSWFSAETGDFVTASPADAQGGELGFDAIGEMYGGLEDKNVAADDTAAIISAPRYFRRLKASKISNYAGQTTGQPYMIGGPLIPDARLGEFIGPFDRTTQIPTTNKPGQSLGWTTTSNQNKFGDVIVGNWGEMVFGRWGLMELLSDNGVGQGFLRDQIYVKMRMFGDFIIRHAESFAIAPDVRMRN